MAGVLASAPAWQQRCCLISDNKHVPHAVEHQAVGHLVATTVSRHTPEKRGCEYVAPVGSHGKKAGLLMGNKVVTLPENPKGEALKD
ncbi:hypothetical protein [Streptomyces sp. NPDC056682]|uniref:hypothetical protein n=1 Tax=Streptomyces sp. NPDC056682 TaxID=3345909 RepID=UPI00369006A4